MSLSPLARALLISTTGMVLPALASAHHSGAAYDTSRRIEITGTIQAFHWANPHVSLELMAVEGTGPAKTWHVEGGDLGMLVRAGWTRKMLAAGDKVTVTLNPVKSGDAAGALVKVTLADGRVLEGGQTLPPLPATH